MSDFTIQFNRVQEVTGSLHECYSSLSGYKGSLDAVTASLNRNMGARYYVSFKRRLNAIATALESEAKSSNGLGRSLNLIADRYMRTEKGLSPGINSGTKTPYGTIPGESDSKVRDVIDILREIIQKLFDPDNSTARKDIIRKILALFPILAWLNGGQKTADGAVSSGGGAGGGGRGAEEEKSYLDRLSDLFDFPGDISDAIETLYNVFDKEGFDESGAGGVITGILSVISGGADFADSDSASEMYRNGVDFGRDITGAIKATLSMLKHAEIIPDNNWTAGVLFGLKEIKNAAGFSVDFMENYENNQGNWAGFLRDSGDMAEDISKFVQGAVTSKEGFLKGLKGKNLITAEIWGTAVTSLYKTGSYAIGDMIEKAKNGTLDWGSGAESWGKGAVGGLGHIHKFLTLGLVDPDMDETWNIYQKYADRNAELLNKYGKNGFTRAGLLVYGTLDTFIEGSVESIWTASCDAAEKIGDHFDTAYNAVKDTKDYLCDQVSNLISSLW